MTNNSDFESYKAKEKVKSLALLLVFGIILGGVWEYQKTQTSLDSVWILYNVTNEVDGLSNQKAEKVEVIETSKEEVVEAEKVEVVETPKEEVVEAEKVEVVETPKEEVVEVEKVEVVETTKEDGQQEVVENEVDKNAAGEFLGYMGEIKDKLNSIDIPVMALDKIVVKIDESKPLEENANFKDGEIEIYDSELGVVGVEKVEIVTEKDESQKEEVTDNQSVENKEENSQEIIEEEVEETIDMMKNIINRNMEEK